VLGETWMNCSKGERYTTNEREQDKKIAMDGCTAKHVETPFFLSNYSGGQATGIMVL